jgi:hypothetical protein
VILEMLGMRLATYVDLAKELGVKTNQVYMWHTRRTRNGFPEPVLHRDAGNGVTDAPWFDIDEVITWHASYAPGKGGFHTHRRRTS